MSYNVLTTVKSMTLLLYRVHQKEADQISFLTQAFEDFVSRGLSGVSVKVLCNPILIECAEASM